MCVCVCGVWLWVCLGGGWVGSQVAEIVTNSEQFWNAVQTLDADDVNAMSDEDGTFLLVAQLVKLLTQRPAVRADALR